MRKVGLSYFCSADCTTAEITKPKKRTRPNSLSIETRKMVRQRDKNVCRWCGDKAQHVHHIRYRSQGGSDDTINLISLCRGCHDTVHSSKKHYQPILLELVLLPPRILGRSYIQQKEKDSGRADQLDGRIHPRGPDRYW